MNRPELKLPELALPEVKRPELRMPDVHFELPLGRPQLGLPDVHLPFRREPSRGERLKARLPFAIGGLLAVVVAVLGGRVLLRRLRKQRYAHDASVLAERAPTYTPTTVAEDDDVTIAQRVETELFRDPSVPKGQINVNAENGRVYLRGQVDDAQLISRLEQTARGVRGVRGVVNLLHAPGSSAPATDAPKQRSNG